MPPLIKIYRSGKLICKTPGTLGESLMQRIISAGVFLDSPCGGTGKCGKCLVRLASDGESVLACQTKVSGDTDVHLPETTVMNIAHGSVEQRHNCTVSAHATPPADAALGVAADIGTTAVVVHLTELATGNRLVTASGVNAQRACGADVISRIKHCIDNGHGTLTRLIREQLGTLILDVCAAVGAEPANIRYLSIAANTVMQHLAAGLSPAGMGAAPFTPASLFGKEFPSWDNLPISKEAKIYYAPAISAYVGGDITAGILAAGLEDTPDPALFIDIGTNGEMVLKTGGTYCCCATAAGPAFEGAEISHGMAAVSGAISHVRWDGDLRLTVIGNADARGLCGSGLLDALAILLETGAVDETGRLLDADCIGHDIAKHIHRVGGGNALCLTSENGGVYLSASDVRKLQLAKSAIAAGIQALLHHAGVAHEAVKSFVLAGGFGSFLDIRNAARVGLFPACFLPVSETLGNTAGEGAAMALCSEAARAKLADISGRCEYIELSTSPVFNEQFVEQMCFPSVLTNFRLYEPPCIVLK